MIKKIKNNPKMVIKICDDCGKEEKIKLISYINTKNKYKRLGKPIKQYCRDCARLRYPTPKRRDINQTFMKKNGYIVKRKDNGSSIYIHREKYETAHNIKLSKNDVIHHINGNEMDNRLENLIHLTNSEHINLHQQLELLARELIKGKLIHFDLKNKKYYLDSSLELKLIPKSFRFDNIKLIQEQNICNSRLETNISSKITKKLERSIPIIAANMSTVINSDFYLKIINLGAMAIMHRAWINNEDYISTMKNISNQTDIVAASIGIDNSQFDLAKKLIREGNCNILCIDVANAWTERTVELAKQIKKFSKSIELIIGNTTNPEILKDISSWCDAIKIGIGQGLACTTKDTAGCTAGQFSVIRQFSHICSDLGIPIISDGGIRSPSDFSIAIGAGASSVMAGSIFSSCIESAAEIVEVDGIKKKLYAGMASEYVQNKWKGGVKNGTCAEGKIIYLPITESIELLLDEYSGALKSGITYSGARNVMEFHQKAKFIEI